jgi:multiple antibiotic resistance protein
MKTIAIAAGETFGALMPIVNPIAVVPAYLALAGQRSPGERALLVRRIVLIMAAILGVFAVTGEPLLHAVGISLEGLQIAGGVAIGYAGFRMLTAPAGVALDAASDDIAFSPLAMPLLAGPGALAAELGLESREESVWAAMPGTLIGIAGICLATYLIFRGADRVSRVLGPAGIDMLRLISGLVVLAIGSEMIVHGITNHGAVVAVG